MGHVCVVDDEPSVLRLLSRTLRDGGLTVDLAESGSAGLVMAARRRYDLLILDLMLPDVDGVTVLQQLRADLPGLQVMVLSAADDAANRVRCLDLGACDFVGKPFDVPELLARVRTRLRSAPATNGPDQSLRVGEVTLDRGRHTLRVGARRVPLAPREFRLLEHLMSRVGEVCTREQLLRAVWGFDFDPGSNVVEVYVSRVRTKLPTDMIETVRSVGYCFLPA